MTLAEIIKFAMMLMRKDRDAAEVDDYTDETEGVNLTSFINEAYEMICRDNWRLYKTEEIALTDGHFNVSELSSAGETVLEISSIKSGNNANGWNVSDKTFGQIDVRGGGDSASVTFYYLPSPLSDDSDTPAFPAVYHDLLGYYAAYMASNVGNKYDLRATQWYSKFEEGRMKMRSGFGDTSKSQFVNKYTR
jgi:hypothetical protein